MKINRGFTLVEVLVAIGLICITIFACKSMISSAILARSVKNEDVALKIASHQIEELRALGYASLPVSGSFSDSMLSSLSSSSASMAISTYDAKTKQITVTVSWIEPASGNRSVVLTTLLAETGGLK
jgi:prepilin-type N-terminal cleavage/methylation domain-containing protein